MNPTPDSTVTSGTDAAGAGRGLPNFVRVFALALGLATLLGVVSSLLLRVATTVIGRPLPWAQAASGWLDWYVWAALTPLVVWLARAVPVRPARWRRSVAAHVVLAGAVALVELALFALAMTLYGELFIDQPLQPFADRYVFLVGRWLPIQMLIYALIVAVVSTIDILAELRARDVRAARLETELSKAQLHALQSQIQPHFLFNVMNTISMSVREGRSQDAVSMIGHLGAMLRRSIAATDRPDSTLEKEFDFVRHYLRLESCRMEGRLRVEWDVDPADLGVVVPAMVLQPLVENAIRHGLADAPRGGTLTIRSHRTGPHVRVLVEDDGVGMPEHPVEGTGIQNIRRRLDTRYQGDARLRIEPRRGGGTVASLIIPRTP